MNTGHCVINLFYEDSFLECFLEFCIAVCNVILSGYGPVRRQNSCSTERRPKSAADNLFMFGLFSKCRRFPTTVSPNGLIGVGNSKNVQTILRNLVRSRWRFFRAPAFPTLHTRGSSGPVYAWHAVSAVDLIDL